MNWLNNFVRPRIKSWLGGQSDTPENLWKKCPKCGEMIFHRDLETSLQVCPKCGHHMRVGAKVRFTQMFDGGAYEVLELPEVVADPLRFKDIKRYSDRLRDARAKSSAKEALSAARGKIDDLPAMVAVQSFEFMGGSLGLAVGEGLVRSMTAAVEENRPYVLFVASGGARMQEGMLSLMQMPRVTVAVDNLHAANLPYIVVLTDPTTGGVSASYAMLGDVQIAEPGALIGFAGARVIEQTMREQLPEGFQRAEYLRDHGMVDMVVPRAEMKETVSRLLHLMTNKTRPQARRTPQVIDASRAAD